MPKKKEDHQPFRWHENAGVRILLPSKLVIKQPFPEFYAETKKSEMTFLAMVTADDNSRQSAENIIRQPLMNNEVFIWEPINSGPIQFPYKGLERIIQQYHKVMSRYRYLWERIYYLDDLTGITAYFRVNVDGPFSESQEMMQGSRNGDAASIDTRLHQIGSIDKLRHP